jgi:hypothetical protein
VRFPWAASLALALLLAGCIKVEVSPPPSQAPNASTGGTSSASSYRVTCLLVDENRTPLKSGTCTYRFGTLGAAVAVDHNGTAARNVPAGLTGTLTGEAPGRVGQQARLTVDGTKSVRFPLTKLPAGAKPGTIAPAPGGPTVTTPDLPAPSTGPARSWLPAIAVVSNDYGSEPQVFVAPDGTVYYAPTSELLRSTDGGRTFTDITPALPDAPPTLGSDDSVSIAPDGSLWFSMYWGYPDSTFACTSTDRGTSWTCDNVAIPGITDRMWVVGLSASEGYVMANEGTEYHVWAHTTDGSTTYVPTATTTSSTVRNGPMAYDAVHGKVWQVEFSGDTERLIRVDGATGLTTLTDTSVPAPYSLPWLVAVNGTLWTTGEQGGRMIVARSTDEGQTWQQFPVSLEPKEATFGYVAALPNGRAAVVYYGSDKSGDPANNGGQWSLYIAESDNALSAQPTWVETRLVDSIHTGNLCIGASCDTLGSDTNARMAGDLIGIAMDVEGNAYVSYIRDAGGSFPDEVMRQVLA